ncbi:MAG TPA: hypothetical protein PK567_02255 [Bacillota bacterium]|nr:hypothetical protein [Bacillota bacterium]
MKKWLKILIPCVAAAVLAGVLFLLWFLGVFYDKKDTAPQNFPLSSAMEETIAANEDLTLAYLYSRTTKLLSEDRCVSPYVVSWYVAPGTTREKPGYQSQYIETEYQVLLLETYIRDGNRIEAKKLINALKRDFLCDDGLMLAYRNVAELSLPTAGQKVFEGDDRFENSAILARRDAGLDAPHSLGATIAFLGAVMDYYDKWGTESDYSLMESLATAVFDADTAAGQSLVLVGAVPTPPTIALVDEEAGDASEDGTTTDTEEQTEIVEALPIADLDYDTLRRAVVLFPQYQEQYDAWLAIGRDSMISDALPLYAQGYSEERGYILYSGEDASADLISALKTAVHLEAVGALDERTYAWIKSKIYNDGYLYTHYNVITGEKTSGVEAPDAYLYVMQLARMRGDDDLFKRAFTLMDRNIATLQSSETQFSLFRNVADNRVAVYASENLLAKLILS